jgi:4-hydroxybenzoate polyprenyltransferase
VYTVAQPGQGERRDPSSRADKLRVGATLTLTKPAPRPAAPGPEPGSAQDKARRLMTLARPRMLPWLWILLGLGYAWAHWCGGLDLKAPGGFVLLLGAWAALHAGSLWLNAALDQDDGPVLFGRSVPVPKEATTAGLVALAIAPLLALCVHPVAATAAAGNALLALFYSHPRTAWKGHPLLGPLVNFVGYGLLTPLAGFIIVGWPYQPRTPVMGLVLAFGLLGLTFLAQSFQEAEDRARGYRTLVVTHGARACVHAARLSFGFSALLYSGLAFVEYVPRLTLPALLLLPWCLAAAAPEPSAVRRTFRRLMGATAVAVILACVDHLHCLLTGHLPAGLCHGV